jgi:uncharacterized protein
MGVAGRWLAIAWLVSAACGSAADTPSSPSTAPPAAPARLLVVSHTTGFRHPSIDVAGPVLARAGRDSGAFTTIACATAADVARLLTREALANADGVVFLHTTGNLGIPDLPAFLDWIAAGHGFAGIHSAADTYHDAPGYLAMLGNQFETHGAQAEVDAVVEAPAHPATAHLGTRYRVFDEIYRFVRNNRGEVTPLLTLDRYPDDGLARAGTPGDLPLAWTRLHGSGRVFYTALGHREELWQDPTYVRHVVDGIRWALNR